MRFQGRIQIFSSPLVEEEIFRLQMVWKSQNNVRNYMFLAQYFYQHSQIFSIFIYHGSMPMKSYQFFKICKRFDKEREKTVNEKKKTDNILTLFYNRLLKSFNMIINLFFFYKLICCPIFAFWYQDDARNLKRGNRERQIARNSKWQYLFQK